MNVVTFRDGGQGGNAAASPRDSPFVRLLSDAEEACSTAQGAEQLWQDKARLAAVLEMLKRPASGSAYTQWAASNELRKAAKVSPCSRGSCLKFSAWAC